MIKKLLAIFSFALLFFSFAAPAMAQTDTDAANQLVEIYCQRRSGDTINLETWYGGVCDPNDIERSIGFSDIVFIDLYTKLAGETPGSDINWGEIFTQLLSAKTPEEAQQIASQNQTTNDGIVPILGNLISSMYAAPAASSIDYLAYVKQNIEHKNPIQPAYAQSTGYGFQSLSPILPLWKAFRTISYTLFILVFVIYGFMIMFRVKINPQTVVGIQQALPNIILTLLFVTFSYAIVGLLIDLSYVIYGLTFNLFKASGVIPTGGLGEEMFQIFSGFRLGLWGPFLGLMAHVLSLNLLGKIFAAFLGSTIGSIASIGFVAITGGIGYLIMAIIFFLIIIITIFRILWMLLKSYINIILQTIFAPIILMGNIMPGSNAFGNWLRGLFAEISVFVVTMILFILVFFFIGPIQIAGIELPTVGTQYLNLQNIALTGNQGRFWAPPPLLTLGINDASGVFALIGFGLFLMIPKLADIVRDALKIPPFKHGTGLSEGLKPISAPLGFLWGGISKEMQAGLGNYFSGDYTQTTQDTIGKFKNVAQRLPRGAAERWRNNRAGTPSTGTGTNPGGGVNVS